VPSGQIGPSAATLANIWTPQGDPGTLRFNGVERQPQGEDSQSASAGASECLAWFQEFGSLTQHSTDLGSGVRDEKHDNRRDNEDQQDLLDSVFVDLDSLID
jgi:hypothetical protein